MNVRFEIQNIRILDGADSLRRVAKRISEVRADTVGI
jgi:hypothetical protein